MAVAQVNCQSKLLGERKGYVAAHPITRWDSERRVTPSPTSTTSPATSVPRMFGYFWMNTPVSCVVQVRGSAETSRLTAKKHPHLDLPVHRINCNGMILDQDLIWPWVDLGRRVDLQWSGL